MKGKFEFPILKSILKETELSFFVDFKPEIQFLNELKKEFASTIFCGTSNKTKVFSYLTVLTYTVYLRLLAAKLQLLCCTTYTGRKS